jgi:hypothetical protein
MDSKFFASVAMASVLVFGVLASANFAGAQGDDTWYVGDGVEQDMYVTYRIQEIDTNNGDPFEMTIYFQEQDAGGIWTAPTYVVANGAVHQGTLRLGSDLAALSGGSQVPDAMQEFIGAYGFSLQWLAGFTEQSNPKSLSAGSWGRIANIGGSEIKPLRTEETAVPAGVYDTTVVGWVKGIESRIWIQDGFPYPVKAETYVDITTGNQPIFFAFSLLDVGTGQPTPPEENIEAPQPPLQRDTGRGTYNIAISWEPATIEPDSTVTFVVDFTDAAGAPIERVNYDFTVTDSSGGVVYEKRSSNTGEGSSGLETVQFGDGGQVSVKVKINSASGQTTDPFIEEATFNLVVVPEFPVSAAIIAAVAVGSIVAMTRFRGSFSMFGGKNAL